MKQRLMRYLRYAGFGLALVVFNNLWQAREQVYAAYREASTCQQMPAFTGDATSSAQTCALTAAATIAKYAANGVYTGNNSYSGTSTYTGALLLPTRTVTASGTVVLSATTDYEVCINKTVGGFTPVTLPSSPATGLSYRIKDCKGDANTNNIQLNPAAGLIDGAASYSIKIPRGTADIIYNGTGWDVL